MRRHALPQHPSANGTSEREAPKNPIPFEVETGESSAELHTPDIMIQRETTDKSSDDTYQHEQVYPEQLTEEVIEAINQMLDSQNIWTKGKKPGESNRSDESLTPAQRFYVENKELLLRRAAAYSVERAKNDFEKATRDIEDEWAFYKDPIVRPPRGYLWPVESEEAGANQNQNESSESSSSFIPGIFPSIEDIVSFLERESVKDVVHIDLENCGRRDIGEWAIIGTVKSATHGSRVGSLARRKINQLNLENIKCFMNATVPGQEWVVTRLGPVVLHLMTESDRENYKLEDIYIGDKFGQHDSNIYRLLNPEASSAVLDGNESNI
jgi:ribosomal silencing factor RsfS